VIVYALRASQCQAWGGPIVVLLATVHDRTRREPRTRMVAQRRRPEGKANFARTHRYGLRGTAVDRHRPQSTEPPGDLELDSIRGLCVTVTCARAVDFRRRPAIPNLILHCAGSRYLPTRRAGTQAPPVGPSADGPRHRGHAMPISARRSGMFVVPGSSVRCPSGWPRWSRVSVLEAPKGTGSVGEVDYHVPVGLLAFD
jgi:hypothetical protein